MNPISAERLLDSMRECRAIVLGDLMLDQYFWGEIKRISPEAPVPVMRLQRVEHALGGAANVARNIASLGARVSVLGVIGMDSVSDSLIDELDRAGIDRQGVLIESARRTTRKCRLMSHEHNQQVFRFDDEATGEISETVEDRILATVRERIPNVQVVICSDYLKGVLTRRVLHQVAALACEHSVPLVTAPKDVTAEKYALASVLMPNLREFGRLAGRSLDDRGNPWMEFEALRLINEHQFSALLITRGSEGMTLFEKKDGQLRREDIASIARAVYDVTGAGDTALAVFSLALAAGAVRSKAAYLANMAASIVVGKRGTASVTTEELRERLDEAASHAPISVRAAAD